MPPAASKSGCNLTPSARKAMADAMAADILRPKQKPARPRPKKGATKNPPPPPPQPAQSSEDEEETLPTPRQRREPTPVNLDELQYTISCSTNYEDKKVWFDASACRLKEFKVHDYNTKSIKAVTKEAEKIKMDFELSSCVATIAAGK
jgi:hypothetical protein